MTHCEFNAAQFARDFAREGFSIHEGVVAAEEVAALRAAIEALPEQEAVRRKRNVYGVRNLLEVCPAVAELAKQPAIRRYAATVLGESVFAARAILFDKVAGANWSLFWHQDNVIAVQNRVAIPEYVGWSQKSGVWQVQPPAEVLAKIIAVRVHLDDCGPENGPLRVIPGSHRHGWLDDEIDDWKRRIPEVICTVRAGGIVTMCPLLLHASAPAVIPSHRRVVHIEYAADDLPAPLEWKWRV